MSRRIALGWVLSWFALSSVGCSASAPPRDDGNDGGGFNPIGNGGRSSTAGSNTGIGAIMGNNGGSNGSSGACAASSAEAVLEREAVDIIIVLDNSGSMADELDAVERNINVNFASILAASGVDYRVILLSRHRAAVRTASGEASTSICVQAPLSGLATCPGEQPVFSDRFFQYSAKLESLDSFDVILDTFEPPFAPKGGVVLSDRADKFDQAPLGWSAWLRPGAKKVFLEMTDDNAQMPLETFLQQLTQLGPEFFGTDPTHPDLVFHSIIGIATKPTITDAWLPTEAIQVGECTATEVANSGPSYQQLSVMTGGLRFPICEFNSYDAVFRTIANDVVVKASLACDFAIPPSPDGRTLELDNVAVSFTRLDNTEEKFGQAPTALECQDDAFYITNQRVYLCPATCDRIRTAGGAVDVLFTCESQIIVR